MPTSTAETTTAYLDDGRHVVVDEHHVESWRTEVEDGATTLGLAQWYTDDDQNEDEIRGEAEDMPRCEHLRAERGQVAQVRVVNASQAGEYVKGAPHASIWVCARRACVLDALSWVERATDEPAVWLDQHGDAHQIILGHGLIEHAAPEVG